MTVFIDGQEVTGCSAVKVIYDLEDRVQELRVTCDESGITQDVIDADGHVVASFFETAEEAALFVDDVTEEDDDESDDND